MVYRTYFPSVFKRKTLPVYVCRLCFSIIADVDRVAVIAERIRIRKEYEKEDKVKEEKKKLDAIFRKMGKDPSKMKNVIK